MSMTVTPRSEFIFFSNVSIDIVVSGSSADVASSESKISGLEDSALAIATRCFCPPDSSAGYALALSASPTRSSNSSAFLFLSRRLTPEIF